VKLVFVIARAVGNLPNDFGVSGTFRSLLMDQHLSDSPRDMATLTFDFGDHVTDTASYGSSCCICKPSFNFVGLPARKI